MLPCRALPLPFCLQGFLPPPLLSLRFFTLAVPCGLTANTVSYVIQRTDTYMQIMLLTFLSQFFINLIDSMLPCVCAVIDNRRHQFVVKLISVAHSFHGSCATFLFFPHFDTSVSIRQTQGNIRGQKKLEIQLALRTSSSQIVLACFND